MIHHIIHIGVQALGPMPALLVQQADRIFAVSVNQVDVIKITRCSIFRAALEALVPPSAAERENVCNGCFELSQCVCVTGSHSLRLHQPAPRPPAVPVHYLPQNEGGATCRAAIGRGEKLLVVASSPPQQPNPHQRFSHTVPRYLAAAAPAAAGVHLLNGGAFEITQQHNKQFPLSRVFNCVHHLSRRRFTCGLFSDNR